MSEAFTNKKILIVYPPTEAGGYKNSIIFPMLQQLKSMGADVTILNIDHPPIFRNDYFPDKIRNILKRVLFKDIHYYHYIQIKHASRYYLKELNKQTKGKKYDYTLVVRPDRFTLPFIKQLKKKTNILSSYMWTAVKRGTEKNLLQTRPYYDTAFGFDPFQNNKYKEFKWSFAPNFIYKYDKTSPTKDFDLFYFGSNYTNRRDLLSYGLLSQLSDSFYIKIFINENDLKASEKIQDNRLEYTYQEVPYLDFVYESSKTKVVLDICKPEHKGLTFRPFEALSLGLKLIVNNEDIVNYDFYHPDNICIVDFAQPKLDEIKAFLAKPYQKIDDKIIYKYSFENWIQCVFNMDHHIPFQS